MTPPSLGAPELRAEKVTVDFGGNRVLDGVDVELRSGELVGIIGPNGAGKTTLFEVISGFTQPTEGTVWLRGTDVTGWPTHRRARGGLARSFQDATLFGALTTFEVLQVALERHVAPTTDAIGEVCRLPASRRAERWSRRRADALLERFRLGEARNRRVAELSTGMRRILELATVIALEPRVLLLDEPTAGVAQAETGALADLIASVRAQDGVAMLLIEHDVPMIMRLCDRVYVLEAGALIAEGAPDDVVQNDRVIRAYLGADFAEAVRHA